MKVETKEIYKCEFCNKLYQISKYCLLHERVCAKNPYNDRPCFKCNHLTKTTETIYYDNFNGEQQRDVDILYCNKLDIFLYPPKVEYKENWLETSSKENNPMPKTCELYNDNIFDIN
jgi:hypothetical protein